MKTSIFIKVDFIAEVLVLTGAGAGAIPSEMAPQNCVYLFLPPLPLSRHELGDHVPGVAAGRHHGGHVGALGHVVGGLGHVRLGHHGHGLVRGRRLVHGQQHVPGQNGQQVYGRV